MDCVEKVTCRLCDSTALETVLELMPTPPGNRVLTKAETLQPQPTFPLVVKFCAACCHVQLGHVVAPEILYRDHYSYVSNTSSVFVEHFRRYAEHAVELCGLKTGDLVIDIGSNDGTGLSFFRDRGMKVLGVDPASDIAATANTRGIETIDAFFNVNLAKRVRAERGGARLVSSHNACAHIDDLGGVVDGVRTLLADDGYFVMEVGYFVDVFSNCWFDTIYHEHLDYHTVAPLVGFFQRHGMHVVAVERIAPQGGSIRVITRPGTGSPDVSVEELIRLEREHALHQPATIRNLQSKLAGIRGTLRDLLSGLKRDGKTIAGYGAPTKSTTLMLHFGIGADSLDFIVDDNPLKQGCYTPGTFVEIGPAKMLYDRKPDYVLVLAWNFAESIIKQHPDFAGRFIVPMPIPKIVEAA